MKQASKESKGFTLIELLIVMAILAIIGTIALPAYLGYVQEAKIHAAMQNSEPLHLALESYFLDNSSYVAGTWVPDGTQTLQTGPLGWRPDGDGNKYTYTVAAGDGGIATSYTITVQSLDGDATITCTRDAAASTYGCSTPAATTPAP